MRKVFIIFLFLTLPHLLVSCQQSDQGRYSGYLYFMQGSYLMRFSLRDFSLEAVTHLGNKKIREISGFGDDRLLISETALVNRRNVARISWLDLKTGMASALYPGIQARYVAGAMLYDDGSKLYSITQVDGTEITANIMSYKRHRLSAMVEVSGGRLLLETQEEGQPVIHAYHVQDGGLSTLDQLADVCSLKGAVWMDDVEQLACRERNREGDGAEDKYIFAGLDGQVLSRPVLPEGEKFLALAYLSGQGALILKESWHSQIDGQEKSAVWAHDIYTGDNHELSDTLNLGTSVVFTNF